MRRIAVLFISCLAAGAVGCAEGGPIVVDAHDGPAIRMSGLGSQYTWAQVPEEPMANADVHRVITETIDQELARKGFKKTDPASCNFWVDYRVIKENKTDSSIYPHGVVYPRGTMIIRTIDPPTRRIIWGASAQAHLMTNASPEDRKKRIDEAVRKMLDLMPPR